MKVKFKKLHPNAKLPSYAKPGDAGMDLCACLDMINWSKVMNPEDYAIYVAPGTIELIPIGLSMELPPGYEAQIRPRSGLALKEGITVLNSPGTIDEGYRGPVGIILINHLQSNFSFKVTNGMKIAQMVIKPVERAEIEEVEELSDTERGQGGFGSTGE